MKKISNNGHGSYRKSIALKVIFSTHTTIRISVAVERTSIHWKHSLLLSIDSALMRNSEKELTFDGRKQTLIVDGIKKINTTRKKTRRCALGKKDDIELYVLKVQVFSPKIEDVQETH